MKPELVPDVSFYAACNAPGSRPVSWRRASTLKSLWMRATAVQDSKISRKLKRLKAGGEIPGAGFFANIGSCLDAPPLGIMLRQATQGDQPVELKQAAATKQGVMSALNHFWTHVLLCSLAVVFQPLLRARLAGVDTTR